MARCAFIVLDLLIASRVFEISRGTDLDDTAKQVTKWVDDFIGDYKKTWTVLKSTDASVIATTILDNGTDCAAFETAIAADTSNMEDMAHTFHCAVPTGKGTIVQDSCDIWYWDALNYQYPGEAATNAAACNTTQPGYASKNAFVILYGHSTSQIACTTGKVKNEGKEEYVLCLFKQPITDGELATGTTVKSVVFANDCFCFLSNKIGINKEKEPNFKSCDTNLDCKKILTTPKEEPATTTEVATSKAEQETTGEVVTSKSEHETTSEVAKSTHEHTTTQSEFLQIFHFFSC